MDKSLLGKAGFAMELDLETFLTPVAAKLAAYNLGIWINRSLGRPDIAFATLIV